MKAMIFDFDGVIVDSERFWRPEENRMFSKLLPQWKPEDHHSIIVGRTIEDTYPILQRQYGLSISRDEYLQRYAVIGQRVYQSANLIEGVEQFINACVSSGLLTAIASSAQKKYIDSVLEKYSFKDHIRCIASADDIPKGKGKPDPKLYRTAAEKLGVDPAQCIAIEDAANGVQSAKAAGMYCIGLRNGSNDSQDLSKADRIIHHFNELDVEELKSM